MAGQACAFRRALPPPAHARFSDHCARSGRAQTRLPGFESKCVPTLLHRDDYRISFWSYHSNQPPLYVRLAGVGRPVHVRSLGGWRIRSDRKTRLYGHRRLAYLMHDPGALQHVRQFLSRVVMPRGRRPRWYLRHERSRLLSARQIRFRKNYNLRVARHILEQISLRLLRRLRLLGHSRLCSRSPRCNCNRQDGSFYGLSSVHSISSPIGSGLSQQTSGSANHSFCFKELAESNLTPLAPIPRYFVTAKESFRIFRGAVKVDHIYLDTGGDLFRV